MAFFKSADQKQAEKEQKELEMLEKYGLENLTNPADIKSVRKIISELTGTGLMEFGNMLSPNEKDMLRVQMQYQRAIVEQNFLLIRLLSELNSKIG